jgi:hypothetical protein
LADLAVHATAQAERPRRETRSLRVRYSEIVKLRELVKQARSKITEEAKIDDLTDRR